MSASNTSPSGTPGSGALPGLGPRDERRPLRPEEKSLIPGYELLDYLGGGGMGAVYKARQIGLDRLVAVKLLRPDLAADPEQVQRFLSEARIAGKLRHENIVSALDCGVAGSLRYLVMEFVEGQTLDQLLEFRGKLGQIESLDYARQVAEALRYAWSHKIIHRDVKPQNLMVTPENVAKLCDLGLCRNTRTDVHLTTTGFVNCTPTHASPEQARGDRDLDCRTDLYSLGVLLYQMTTGELPFKGKSVGDLLIKQATETPVPPIQKNPEISPRVNALILRLMEKNREKRPANPEEVVGTLQALLKEARGESAPPPRVRPASTRRALSESSDPVIRHGPKVLVGGAAAMAVIGLIAFAAIQSMTSKKRPVPTATQVAAEEPVREAPPPNPAAVRAAEAMARLEKRDARSVDAQEMLELCEELRPLLQGTVHEVKFKEIEQAARTRRETELFNRFVQEIHLAIERDPFGSRQAEIERMIQTAGRMKSARPEAIEDARSRLRANLVAAAQKRTPAPVKPAPAEAPKPAGSHEERLANYDLEIRGLIDREEFKAALARLDEELKRSPSGPQYAAWSLRKSQLAWEIGRVYHRLRNEALAALRDGDRSKARSLRERITGWALPASESMLPTAAEFDKEVGSFVPATLPPRSHQATLVFKGRLWIIGGAKETAGDRGSTASSADDVWSSADGKSWTQVAVKPPFPHRRSCGAVVFKDRMWLIGGLGYTGMMGDVWSSDDGVQWTRAAVEAAFGPRVAPGCVVFKGRIWIIGGSAKEGLRSDVWTSEDGLQWTQVAVQTPFRNLGGSQLCVVFGSRIWRLAGDLWSTEDGVTWTRASTTPPLGFKYGVAATVFKDQLFVIGGGQSRRHTSDVWSSADGVRWTQITPDAAFPARSYHSTAAFDGRLWVLQGNDGENRSDIWASADGRTFVRTDAP